MQCQPVGRQPAGPASQSRWSAQRSEEGRGVGGEGSGIHCVPPCSGSPRAVTHSLTHSLGRFGQSCLVRWRLQHSTHVPPSPPRLPPPVWQETAPLRLANHSVRPCRLCLSLTRASCQHSAPTLLSPSRALI
jgi:hypothetical protein